MAVCATATASTATMASLINQKPFHPLQWRLFPTVKSSSKSRSIWIARCKLDNKSSIDSSSSSSSSSCCSVPRLSAKEEAAGEIRPKRRSVATGIVAAMAAAAVVMGSTLEADATRIEYYATVYDPPCELNYVRSGLAYCDLIVGSGPPAPYNELINVHYTARFGDEIVFDSSYKRGRALTMRIGVGKVIRGLDQGIFGGDGVPPMQVGGKRKLRIPPELAYGPEAAGCFSGDCNIPANSTLLYDINFVGIYSGNRPR